MRCLGADKGYRKALADLAERARQQVGAVEEERLRGCELSRLTFQIRTLWTQLTTLANAREARTDWRVLARVDKTTLLEVHLHTGRTHQIRVHFSALRHPVVGDTLYGAAAQLRVGRVALPALERNFLHAAKLGFSHPHTNAWIELNAPLPETLRSFLQKLAAASDESWERIDAALRPYL